MKACHYPSCMMGGGCSDEPKCDEDDVPNIVKEAELRGYQRAIEQMRAAIKREQNYREFREDQDGSGVGACKEILGYLTALENTEKQK